jgi:hypothetical protein
MKLRKVVRQVAGLLAQFDPLDVPVRNPPHELAVDLGQRQDRVPPSISLKAVDEVYHAILEAANGEAMDDVYHERAGMEA